MSGIKPNEARVVVTGAGSGIGRAVALRYAAHGAFVVATDIDRAAAELTATECSRRGARALFEQCDVADADAVTELAAWVHDELGPVDVLVNNAGVGVGGSFLDTTAEDWEWLRSINLDGVVHGCRAFGAAMVERHRGQIVNISSGAAYLPNRRLAAYCASKSAVLMFSKCLRADWARHQVGVSAVCPGVIKTPILHNTRLRGDTVNEKGRFAKAFAMGHSPDSVAKAVIGAAQHNRAMVSVGIETHLGYHALRLMPVFNGLVARA